MFAKGLREPIEIFEAIACPHHDLSLQMVPGLLLLGVNVGMHLAASKRKSPGK